MQFSKFLANPTHKITELKYQHFLGNSHFRHHQFSNENSSKIFWRKVTVIPPPFINYADLYLLKCWYRCMVIPGIGCQFLNFTTSSKLRLAILRDTSETQNLVSSLSISMKPSASIDCNAFFMG